MPRNLQQWRVLEAADLECERGGRALFRNLSFALGAGELLRVAGPNGSGKTSLLRILCGLLPPARGEVRWNGERIQALREDFSRQLVYVGHAPAIKDDLTAYENLMIACVLAGHAQEGPRLLEALRNFGLKEHDVPVKSLSQGQRRRAALARLALSGRSPLWLLDEPFAALDADAARLLEDAVAAHVARGGLVVYSTHQESRIGGRLISLDA